MPYIRPVEKIRESPSFRLVDICKRQTLVKGRTRIITSEMILNPAVNMMLLVPIQVPEISRFQSRARGEQFMMMRKNSMIQNKTLSRIKAVVYQNMYAFP